MPPECGLLPTAWAQLTERQASMTVRPADGILRLDVLNTQVVWPLSREGACEVAGNHWKNTLQILLQSELRNGTTIPVRNNHRTVEKLLLLAGRKGGSTQLNLDGKPLDRATRLASLPSASKITLSRFSVAVSRSVTNLVLVHSNRIYWLRPSGAKYSGSWTSAGQFSLRPGRPADFISMLHRLSTKHRLPDALFDVGLGDVPTSSSGPVPTLTIHGWDRSSVPVPRFTTQHQVDRELAAVVEASAPGGGLPERGPLAWASKVGTLIWKGRAYPSQMRCDPFREGRTEILRLAARHPSLITIPEASTRTSYYPDWARHKYVLCLDGVGPSFRLQFLMQLNSVVFLPEQVAPNWLTAIMRPHVHYIPVARNLSDLPERVRWAREHDMEARTIAANAFLLMRHHANAKLRDCALLASLRAVSKVQAGLEIVVSGDRHSGRAHGAVAALGLRGACGLCGASEKDLS